MCVSVCLSVISVVKRPIKLKFSGEIEDTKISILRKKIIMIAFTMKTQARISELNRLIKGSNLCLGHFYFSDYNALYELELD